MPYYWHSDDTLIYALLACGKKEKMDLEPEEAKSCCGFCQGDQGRMQEQAMSEMTKFGADLIQAMSEALAHSQGKDARHARRLC